MTGSCVWCGDECDEMDGRLCPACEHREGPEPDGEDWRGGEASAYEREQQAEMQRLK